MIELAKLAQLKPLFRLFSSGGHLNRLQASELWYALEQEQQAYTDLFTALGFNLMVDPRGFAYFHSEQGGSYTGKITRRLALFLMLLFEFQADKGNNLFDFHQWHLDNNLLEQLWQHYQTVLQAEELSSVDSFRELLDQATKLGFAEGEQGHYQLLASVHRYLDLFQQLAEQPAMSNDDTHADEIASELSDDDKEDSAWT